MTAQLGGAAQTVGGVRRKILAVFKCATFSNCGLPWNWESAHDKYASDRQHISADGSTSSYLRPHSGSTEMFSREPFSERAARQVGMFLPWRSATKPTISVETNNLVFAENTISICSESRMTKIKEPTALITSHLVLSMLAFLKCTLLCCYWANVYSESFTARISQTLDTVSLKYFS